MVSDEISSAIKRAGANGLLRTEVQGRVSSAGWSIDKQPDAQRIMDVVIERLIKSGDVVERKDVAFAGDSLLLWNSHGVRQELAARKPERVLVVDDEFQTREIITTMLASAGYSSVAVAGGLEALDLLDGGEQFSLLICDLMNAPMDGLDLLKKTVERFPGVPIVIATAVHDISVRVACCVAGARDYLLKPFQREEILISVFRALEYRDLRLENLRLSAQSRGQDAEPREKRAGGLRTSLRKLFERV